MSSELKEMKPCPFCGTKKISFVWDAVGEVSGIRCQVCHYVIRWPRIKPKNKSETFGETMNKWTDEWNKRATL